MGNGEGYVPSLWGLWRKSALPRKHVFSPQNCVLWCIQMHHFGDPMREEAGAWGPGDEDIIARNFAEMRNPAF